MTRIDFHLSDVNSSKFATHDKRCFAEARPAGHRPLTVTASAGTVNSTVRRSLSKLRNALDSFFRANSISSYKDSREDVDRPNAFSKENRSIPAQKCAE